MTEAFTEAVEVMSQTAWEQFRLDVLAQLLADGRVSYDIETVAGIHDSILVTLTDKRLKVEEGL